MVRLSQKPMHHSSMHRMALMQLSFSPYTALTNHPATSLRKNLCYT
jgi:hypothetical protein